MFTLLNDSGDGPTSKKKLKSQKKKKRKRCDDEEEEEEEEFPTVGDTCDNTKDYRADCNTETAQKQQQPKTGRQHGNKLCNNTAHV